MQTVLMRRRNERAGERRAARSDLAEIGRALEEPAVHPALARWPGYALRWLSDTGLIYYERLLLPFGVKAPHVSVLVVLNAEGGMVQARLSDLLRIDRATMVSVLNDLESKNWVMRKPHATDRRAFHVEITSAGKTELAQIEKRTDEGTRLFFSILTSDEQETFTALLMKLATQTFETTSDEN